MSPCVAVLQEMEVDAKDCRRSTRVPQPERPEPESEIYVLADMLLPAQWRRLDLSPRTGWVVGAVSRARVERAERAGLQRRRHVRRSSEGRHQRGRRASCARAHACLGRERRACRLVEPH